MAEYSRSSGRKVSEYRKAVFHQGGSFGSGGQNQSVITQLIGDTTSVSQLKHFRGMVTLGPANPTLGTDSYQGRGLIALLRWPISETATWTDLNIDSSALLHPVPWSFLQYPTQVYYEYEAVTLGERERLYMIIWPHYANGSMLFESSFLYNIRKTKV